MKILFPVINKSVFIIKVRNRSFLLWIQISHQRLPFVSMHI